MLTAAIVASAMGFIDGSVLAVAIPQLRADLGASFVEVQWISNAYMLFLAAFMLIGGGLGDRYGIRRVFAVGICIFVVASLLCSIVQSASALIWARAFQGFGAAIMVPGSMALIARNIPEDERGSAMGIWVAASAITTALGPLIGSLILQYGGDAAWRWIFVLNLPLGIFALSALLGFVPRDLPRQNTSLDWLGSLLLMIAMASLAAGLTFLAEPEPFLPPVPLLIIFAISVVAAFIWERKTTHPMIDMRLFQSWSFTGANILTFLVWSGMGAVFFYLPMVLITAWQLSEIYAGAVLLPFAGVLAVLSPIAGRWADRAGVRLPLTFGPVIAALAYLLIGAGLLMRSYWFGILPGVVVLGVAMGLTASPLSNAVMLAVSQDKVGAASGINNMVARMSNLFAVAGLGALLTFIYSRYIRLTALPADIQERMIDLGFGERLTGPLYQVTIVDRQADGMSMALAGLCIVVACLCLMGSLTGFLTQSKKQQ